LDLQGDADALAIVTTTPYGFPLETSVIEREEIILETDDNDLPNTDFVVTSGLVKHGNANGKHYEQSLVLVKQVVLYNLDKYFKLLIPLTSCLESSIGVVREER
jgi:hypothetical protein